jgi:hypothetical protein
MRIRSTGVKKAFYTHYVHVCFMKRGSTAIWGVVLTVLIVAGIGLYYYSIDVPGSAIGGNPYEQHVDYMTCRQNCFGAYHRQRPQISNCLAMCAVPQQAPGPAGPYAVPPEDIGVTGEFARPGAKEYGGAIRGVAEGLGKAFPGRAIELPSQDCYACNCPGKSFGITSVTSDAAELACSNNCGGSISMLHSGICTEKELEQV